MNCIFQIIDNETGKRSEVMTEDRNAFAKRLGSLQDTGEQYSILVLMEKPNDEWEFSKAPIMLKSTFESYFEG